MLGSNVPTKGGLPKAFKYARDWCCECIQIYTTPSRRWDVPKLLPELVVQFAEAWQRSQVKKVVAHVPYLVNLASPDKSLWKKSKERLSIELSIANKLGIPFLVLHPGSYGNSRKESGIKRVIKGLNGVFDNVNNSSTIILLETTAGQGTSIGWCFEEIAYLINKLKYLGVCFDTAHVFEAGYDIRGYDGYKRVLERFHDIIGLDRIEVIHLNDSKTGLGSRVDRHASIGEGLLGLHIFHAIIRDPRFCGIPKILEIPEREEKSKDNLELLRKLRATEELPKNEIPTQKTLERFPK